jgi:hypothetical protein
MFKTTASMVMEALFWAVIGRFLNCYLPLVLTQKHHNHVILTPRRLSPVSSLTLPGSLSPLIAQTADPGMV